VARAARHAAAYGINPAAAAAATAVYSAAHKHLARKSTLARHRGRRVACGGSCSLRAWRITWLVAGGRHHLRRRASASTLCLGVSLAAECTGDVG